MKILYTLALLIPGLFAWSQSSKKTADFEKMAWLIGTWKGDADGQPFFEDWKRVSATEYQNLNFSLCNGDTVVGGRSKIEIRDKKIAYTSGNLVWELKSVSEKVIVFENSRYNENFTFTHTENGQWNAILSYPNARAEYNLSKTGSIPELLQSKPQPIEGVYAGNIEFNGKKLYTEIAFSVENGVQVATASTPVNLQLDQPFQSVCWNPPFVKLSIRDGARALELSAKIENDSVKGKVVGELPATITLVKKTTGNAPKEYTIQQTQITNGETKLDASLFLPKSGKPTGAVIMISGTGQHDKEEYNGWADQLASKGVAVLTYDKRNVTDFPELDIQRHPCDIVLPGQLESDILAAIALLKGKTGIDPQKIGLFGFSQGAVLAPIVAAGNKDVAFVVAVSGNVTTDKEFIIQQSLNNLRQRNFSEEVLNDARQTWEALFQYAKDKNTAKQAKQQIEKAYEAGYGQYAFSRELPTDDEIRYLTTWNSFEHDPAKYWSVMEMPAYVVFGENDHLIPVDSSIAILNTIYSKKPGLLTLKMYANADHFIKSSPDRNNFDFPKFAEGYVEDVVKWIVKETK